MKDKDFIMDKLEYETRIRWLAIRYYMGYGIKINVEELLFLN